MPNSSPVVHIRPVDFSGGVVVLVSGGEQSQILILRHRLKFDKSVPCNQRISLRVGEFFFRFCYFLQIFNFNVFSSWNIFLLSESYLCPTHFPVIIAL